MKVLHLITRMIIGGAQENTMLTVLGQGGRPGWEVRLLTGPTAGPEGFLVPEAVARGAAVEEEALLVRPLRPWTDWRAVRALRRRIRAWRPDVVHTHSSKAGILGRLAAWAEQVPLVVHTIHGLPFHPYQPPPARALYIAAERFAARRCHRIVSVADAMTAQALAAKVGRPEQYETVYSGMEIEPFLRRDRDRRALRRAWGFGEGDFVLAKAARLFELKGHEYLFDAFARLAPGHPALRLFLIGDGAWRGRFEEEVKRRGWTGRVVFAGLVARERMPEALAAADAVVHCSLREGLARVLPQALLSDKPVVSFDVDGAREVVRDGETGWLVPPRDAAGVARAVAEILRQPDEAARRAARGREWCRERFDWRVMAGRLAALYERELSARAALARD